MIWLFACSLLVAGLVVFGGYVRLSRAGLSIVEWQPVRGILPPLGEAGWQRAFTQYQDSPEYRLVNTGMSQAAFRRIFLIEWWHRLIARLAGLAILLPGAWLMATRRIPPGERGRYLLIGALFLGQALMGWLMVASGLVAHPAVSHLRLTLHLLLALALLSLCLWTAFGHAYGLPSRAAKRTWSPVVISLLAMLALLMLQISYGGLTAGLKAGYLSATWPTFQGHWWPLGFYDRALGPLVNLVENPLAVLFVHRWLGWAVLLAALASWLLARLTRLGPAQRLLVLTPLLAVGGQIVLGILVTLGQMNLHLALLHQAWALVILAVTLHALHRLLAPATNR
jgi:heme a synthase